MFSAFLINSNDFLQPNTNENIFEINQRDQCKCYSFTWGLYKDGKPSENCVITQMDLPQYVLNKKKIAARIVNNIAFRK